jgi:hypothetical protein
MAARDEKGQDAPPRKRPPSTIGLWFEEAWEGWLKPLGGIGLLGIAYLLYKFDLLPESVAGAALALIIIAGAIAMTALPAWGLVKTPVMRALFITFLAVWAVGTGYPVMRVALPPRSLAEVKLTPTQLAAKAHVEHSGPLEITVSGHFKGAAMAEADANYTITVDSAGGHDEVSGTLKRALVRYRAGRRGGTTTSIQERTEELHRLPLARGDLTITTDAIDDKLDGGLTVDVRSAGLNPIIFLVLGGLALLLAIFFDARLVIDPKTKVKTYFTAAAATCYVFAIHYPGEATPSSLVRPAVGSLVLALLIGGLGGWLVGFLARVLAGPKTVTKKSRR